MAIKSVPLIKENRIEKLKACLKCIANHPFDRKNQRDCIMELYPGKTEKSVFRGMVIPSLRHLGFIVGYGGRLRVSANAMIILGSESIGDNFHKRSLRAVIYEVDKTKFGFIDVLAEETPIMLGGFIEKVATASDIPNSRIRERVVSWFSVLQQVELVMTNNSLNLNERVCREARDNLDISNVNVEEFRQTLFDEYTKLGKNSAGIVDITDLRVSVVSSLLKKEQKIVTESVFDNVLRNIQFVTEDYVISLGRPMGAEEKLFRYKGNHYRTISIQYLRGG